MLLARSSGKRSEEKEKEEEYVQNKSFRALSGSPFSFPSKPETIESQLIVDFA